MRRDGWHDSAGGRLSGAALMEPKTCTWNRTTRRQSFYDFALADGLVPPALLHLAVMEQFVGGS